MYMVVILILVSILAVIGTLYNKRTNNKAGFLLSALFTVPLIGVTLLAIYDATIGIQ